MSTLTTMILRFVQVEVMVVNLIFTSSMDPLDG